MMTTISFLNRSFGTVVIFIVFLNCLHQCQCRVITTDTSSYPLYKVTKRSKRRSAAQLTTTTSISASTKNNEQLFGRPPYRNLSPVFKNGALFNARSFLPDNGRFLRGRHPLMVLGLAAAAVVTTTTSIHTLVHAEPIRRAVYFWFHAGPIVAHYKFTQWWLDTTKAPVAKRHYIYQQLHDRYSVPSLHIILHLKGMMTVDKFNHLRRLD
jgi:hypothetical protein